MAYREKLGRPPGPRGHWLTGNTREYEADRIGFLRRCHREYGDVFSYDDHTLFVIDPALAHEVLTGTGDTFVTELAPFDMRRDLDQAAEHATSWIPERRAVWPGLNRTAAATTDDLTAKVLDAVIADGAGQDVDVLTTMRTLTARTIAEYCFGADRAGIAELLHETVRATQAFAEASHEYPAWLPLPRHRRYFRTYRRLTERLTGMVRERRASMADMPCDDLLGFLLAAEPAPPVDTVVSTLHSVLMGGHGVPAAALASVVWELARRPRLVLDLRDEADGPAGGGTPLAEAVVRETLRLYPPAWLMTRTAATATTLGEWSLSPGDDVLLNPYLIHRDPRWWSRPDEFDPTRWLDGQAAPGPAYLPFGAGPRVCLGAALTMRQLTLTTSWLAHRFTIESPNAASVTLEFVDRLAPAHLRARFLPTA
ncbi:cytochrome P450 [Streptomyces sp. NBC_01261]|uniref:cytochrome P450 n=1 Tax=Streptomyces sp. NBC_01261 TaxID=2903802 RepID=UPI002E356784|nr:cytochrome P450 [Streptomyces sp. NBC_01261]